MKKEKNKEKLLRKTVKNKVKRNDDLMYTY